MFLKRILTGICLLTLAASGWLLTKFWCSLLKITSWIWRDSTGHWFAVASKYHDQYYNTVTWWLWVALWSIIFCGIGIVLLVNSADDQPVMTKTSAILHIVAGVPLAVVLAVSVIGGTLLAINNAGIKGLGDNDGKTHAEYYTRSVRYAVGTGSIPQSLNRLSNGSTMQTERDADGIEVQVLVGAHDVDGRIIVGDLPEEGWMPRRDSYDTAVSVMQKSLGQVSSTDLLPETVANVGGTDYTGIRDGKGKNNAHVDSIVGWNGKSSTAKVLCAFEGNYELTRAIRGSKENSLNHILFANLPSGWWYELEDVYGFCTPQGEPILVFPMLRYELIGMRTVVTTADVVLVRGSKSGSPQFIRVPSIEDGIGVGVPDEIGKIPGAVYPLSLARTQREQSNWSAGRGNNNHGRFGYVPVSSPTQTTNTSEYLLESNAPGGGLEFVTPMRTAKSTAQTTVAWAVVPANSMRSGQLNQMTIYVLNDGDSRIINFEGLESIVMRYMGQMDANFSGNGGTLREFMPAEKNVWTAYAVDRNNYPRFSIEVRFEENQRLVIYRDGETKQELATFRAISVAAADGTSACDPELGSLDTSTLMECYVDVGEEIGRRLSGPTG